MVEIVEERGMIRSVVHQIGKALLLLQLAGLTNPLVGELSISNTQSIHRCTCR